MNHSPTKRKTSTGLLRSPVLAILFTLLLIASLVPLAINFSHAAAAQETALSETAEDATAVVEDATAVSDLQSDDAETQPSDQIPVDDAVSTQDSQETPAGQEPSFWGRLWQSFKDFFGFSKDNTDKDTTDPTSDENEDTITPIVEGQTRFIINKKVVVKNSQGQTNDTQTKELVEKLKKENKTFKFTWQCEQPDKTVSSSSLLVKVDEEGDSALGVPVGSKCTVTEELNSAYIEGYYHNLAVPDENDIQKTGLNSIDFTLTSNDPFKFTAQNEYTVVEQETGQFTLEKKVEGLEEKDKDKEFEFTWVCREDENTATKGETKLKNGARVTVTRLPLNSTCQISEKAPEIDGYTHLLNWEINGEERVTPTDTVFVDPRKAEKQPPVVTAVNTYVKEDNPVPPKPPVPGKGTFTLKKEVKGLTEDKEFEFSWICRGEQGTQPVRGGIKLKNGATFKVKDLPLDSTCMISEKNAAVAGFKHSLQWLTNGEPKSKDNIVAIDPRSTTEAELVVTAVNTYTKDTKPAPTTTSSSAAPTTTTSSSTTRPAPTTSATSSMTPTTSASSTSSATTTSSATSTSVTSSAKPTTTTSSTEPIVPTTTSKFPPIIPIPIPIPVPPAPFPPAPAPAPNGVSNTPATPHHSGNNTAQTQQNNGKNTTAATPNQTNKGKGLANTGASVIWLALVALLLAVVGGFITYRGRLNKNN
ncbi:DUF5979 domain-containing protein [Corynebacterium kutscheri]|uniref:DUF5979 domain-containing protein n=1 Tax=Corynebacterium kutscheri TaxID=35755 RepID=UPI0037BE692F